MKKASYHIESIDRKEKKRNPVPPFITSTLQQEASRHYGFSVARTMNIAQGLYEGIDMGSDGAEGLITYMRTDSVHIAPEAVQAARTYIQKQFGSEYLPDTPRQYASKKLAQEAHEAIRPTNLARTPEKIRSHLTIEQYKLYLLIWRRFIASQMTPAIYDQVSVDIGTDQHLLLRATGSQLKFNGFLAVYEEKQDRGHGTDVDENESKLLPQLEAGMKLHLETATSEQSFTKPPPRFTEASLVKELEKLGIGRPSTYAAIMAKIQSRDYTVKEQQALKPTDLGRVIAQMLEDNFKMIMDVGFTAAMEDELEQIAEHDKNWKETIRRFWEEFNPLVEKAEKEAIVPKQLTDNPCPKCGHFLQKIWSRNKYFYGCSNYPDCDFTEPLEALTFNKEDYDPHFNWEQPCPICNSPMTIRHGRFGPFLGCSKYPDCKGIINITKKGEAPLPDMPKCPAVGCDGMISPRTSRFGKRFFSCSNFPDCDVIVNDVADLKTKYPDHPKTAYVKKKGVKGGGRFQQSPKQLSAELQAITGAAELTRGEVLKKVWEYIKKHKLQDSKNKRLIVPDAKLAKVFGSKEPVDMMRISSLIGPHLKK